MGSGGPYRFEGPWRAEDRRLVERVLQEWCEAGASEWVALYLPSAVDPNTVFRVWQVGRWGLVAAANARRLVQALVTRFAEPERRR